MELAIVIAVVVVALCFDYTNGFHDAANAIATSVSTRALTPRIALTMAAVMNFVGAFLGQKVAQTVSEVITPPAGTHGPGRRARRAARRDHLEPDHLVLRAALVLLARPHRRPGRGGAGGHRRRRDGTVHWSTILDKVAHPDGGLAAGRLRAGVPVMLAIMWIFRRRNPHRVTRGFRFTPDRSRRRRWPSGTACRTPRRRWA